MKATLSKLIAREHLSRSEARDLIDRLAPLSASPAVAGALLAALRAKGETAEELAGLVDGMMARCVRPSFAEAAQTRGAIDLVGTGGDGASTVNISTAAALVVAGCGVPVVKHGARAVSSSCGSADVLAALGMPMPSADDDNRLALEEAGFAFLFAPAHHPATAELAAIRRELGVRTVFNILGPLCNPAGVRRGVLGAFSESVAELIGAALSRLEIERFLVVYGAPAADGGSNGAGLDEATPIGPVVVLDVEPGEVRRWMLDPADLGMPRCSIEDLRGADAAQNAKVLSRLLERGEGHPAVRNSVVLTAALGLLVAGKVKTVMEGVQTAASRLGPGGPVALNFVALQRRWGLARSALVSGGVCRA